MKKLITATDVREYKNKEITQVVANVCDTIITPEAIDLAKTLGIVFVKDLTTKFESLEKVNDLYTPDEKTSVNHSTLNKIRDEIYSRINLKELDSSLIDSIIQKTLTELSTHELNCTRQINDDGIVLVQGNTVNLGRFDGVIDKNIGLTDVIGSEQNCQLGVGYMGWEKAFFPWTLNYDEIDIILEGELHVKTHSGITVGKPGDVIYIPKGSSVEFGTPTQVRFVYVTYPANWSK